MDGWIEVVQKKVRARVHPYSEKWSPPELGWIKVNTDGAVLKGANKGGSGVVLGDHNSAFRGAAAHFLPSMANPEIVELLACKKALMFAREIGMSKIHVEMDCKEAVGMINEPCRNLSVAGSIVEDIKSKLLGREGCKVTWNRRTANKAAHTLAKLAVGEECCQKWRAMPPECVLHVISDEIPNFD
ncbi:uncharacterized protein [Aegilops tauschii subsp. strangulata]|uniref:uncharacterized protein n=1 Tax=Aegilops tauschii subsp. strangulata TaxID=200361 RepID=UPI003CC8BDF7